VLTNERLDVRFGPWRATTMRRNIVSAIVTGPYFAPKVIGPPHLSLRDRGVTFATNAEAGVCLTLAEPIPAIEPFGWIRHPSITVTVADPLELASRLIADAAADGSDVAAMTEALHDDLSALTSSQLRSRARSVGVQGVSRMSKQELLAALGPDDHARG
jgi:hypothetical protein